MAVIMMSRGCLAANVAQARRPKAYAKGLIKRPELMPVRRFAPPGLPLDGGSLRILKVDLNQRKRQSDGGDNDEPGLLGSECCPSSTTESIRQGTNKKTRTYARPPLRAARSTA